MFKPLELPPGVMEKLHAAKEAEISRKAVFANLSNTDLIASAKFWLSHCEIPKRFEPDAPVYDATFYHIIVPELLRRLSQGEN